MFRLAKKWNCYDDLSNITIDAFLMIIARIEENEHVSEQRHCFICRCKSLSTADLLKAKRVHWNIENSLHWVLDIVFREDESEAGKDFSAENLNALRQFAYNI